MTVSPQIAPQPVESTERGNIRAADLLANDLEPVCPRCNKRTGTHALVCVECCALYGMPAPPIPWVSEVMLPGQHHRTGLAA